MKITPKERHKVIQFLNEFYKRYPQEKYTVFHYVKWLKARLKQNKDAWSAVSGETGTGKSYFVIMAQILFGRPFDLTKNIVYIPTGDEIVDKFSLLNFNTLLVDEAAKEMRSVNWQSKAQQKVNVTAMTDRFKNNAVFLNMPNFNEFTKSMRRGNLIFRAVLVYRTDLYARVVIHRKSRNWRSEDPWGDELANKRYNKAEKKYGELSNNIIDRIERSLPNTVMDFIIPNLALIVPKIINEYERLKIESRKQDRENEINTAPDVWKKKYNTLTAKVGKLLLLNELGLGKRRVSQKEIAEALGISQSTLMKWIKKDSIRSKVMVRNSGDALE